MFKSKLGLASLGTIGLFIAVLLVFQIPAVNQRLSWQADVAMTYLRGILHPVEDMPTALPQPVVAVTLHPSATPTENRDRPTANPTQGPRPTQTPTPTPLPSSISLTPPKWEKQGPNNCGPATLALYLRTFGWEGTQEDIAKLVKPQEDDRNVNVDELVYYVRNQAGWLNAEFRVGGNIELLKSFLASGLPIMIEEGFYLDESYWPNDDRWAGHYLLLTGYDDRTQTFTAQDSFLGADRPVTYQKVSQQWQAFNNVYIMLYRPEQEEHVKSLLGDDWDADTNRTHALDLAQAQTKSDPTNAYAWFNLGSNLVYFERYGEAARAYDKARELGLPQRMLRYQFGPFFAYFFSGRNPDLMALVKYALERTPNSEEALLWKGWGLYRDGKKGEAIDSFNAALQENPNYQDAKYALDFVTSSP